MQRSRETLDLRDVWLADEVHLQALARDADRVGALVGRAWVSGHLHDFASSRALAARALALDPGQARAHGLLGDAALATGDLETAERHYQQMLDLRPDQASYSRAAELLLASGDRGGAIELMELAVGAGSRFGENTDGCRARLAEMRAEAATTGYAAPGGSTASIRWGPGSEAARASSRARSSARSTRTPGTP